MESELEKELSHPFIHAPPYLNLYVSTNVFVNSEGMIEYKMSDFEEEMIEKYWNLLSGSFFQSLNFFKFIIK